jgi:DNA-binding CsgD family transcriptional regulator
MRSNPEKSFTKALNIKLEAMGQKDHEAELIALQTICSYYKKQNDFKNLITSSEDLFNKAVQYNNLIYKAIAKDYLSNALVFNEFYDMALEQLKQGLQLIDQADGNDSIVIDTKANLYVSLSNYYSILQDGKNRLMYIKLSIAEHDKFSNAAYREKLRYIDFSNLAITYYEQDMDSAEVYALKSVSLDRNYGMDDVKFCNLLILGSLNQMKGKYLDAFTYFHQAELVENYKNHLNVELLYLNIIEAYKATGDTSNVKKYENKLAAFKLRVAENKNKSLHKIIEDKELNAKNQLNNILFLAFIVFLLLMGGGIIYILHKNRLISHYEKLSNKYLEDRAKKPGQEDLVKLIEMVKGNNAAFMSSFNEVFPDFAMKLLAINPRVVQTEIEFCALLKLNLHTKEIARYRNIEPRTVQNKKYLIRKKLNIPGEVDIYHWFSEL